MNQGYDSKVKRIIKLLVQESFSQVGSLRISNYDTSDQVELIGMMTEKNDTELFQHLRYEPLFGENVIKQSTYVFEIKEKSPALYEHGIRYGMIVPFYNQNEMMGTVFLGSSFEYTNEVVDIIQKKVRNFAEYYKESLLSESNEPGSVKVKEPLKVRLKRYEQSAKALFEHNPDVMWWMDTNGTIISVNSRVEDICGFHKDHFVNQSFDQFFANKDLDTAIGCFVLAKKGKPQNLEATFIHSNGHDVELNITFVPVTVDYKIVGVYCIAKDITERKIYESALKESNEFITNIMESITDGFLAVDSVWRITYWNKEAELLTDKKPEGILGAVLWDVLPFWVETPSFPKLHKALNEQVTVQYEFYSQSTDKWYWVHAYPSKNGLSIYINDITGRKKAEQQVTYMTYYDTLTELPNHTLFKERLNSTLMRAKNIHDSFAVMVIDLDRFKMINDLLGYGKGDRVMIWVSKRLVSCVREDDTICRYEGDKFTVLLRKINHVKAERIAERIIKAFQKPFNIDHQEIVITPSIGISFYPDDGNDSEQLLANAETAMFLVKENGKNNFQLYNEGMNTRSSLNMITDLQKALDRNELMVVYQPQVDIRTGKIIGAEALLRWNHPELGLVLPAEFIPLAEETGLIIPIGEWVLKTACVQNKAWHDAGFEPMVISVNLSLRQITQNNIVEVVKKALEETGLAPQYLDLEITESMTMDLNRVLETLVQLKTLGTRISMDDFGKGYSSLSYLKRLPIDTLKIDQSFVQDCTVDDSDAMIVKTIISMAHSLDLNVIAEGVETREHLVFLQQNLCNEVQGYLFSKPVPALEFEQQFSEIQGRVKQYGMGAELTERMWIEEQLRVARQDLEDTVRKQQGMTFKFREQNGGFVHSLCDGELLYRIGLSPEKIVGKELHDIFPQVLADSILQNYRKAWQGEPNVTYENVYNGIWFLASLRPLTRGGRVVEVIGNMIDITARKRMEEELRKSEALAAVGELAAGIAHEIRNPITSIKGFVQLMKSDQIKPEYFDIIFSEFKNLETKIDELLLLAKPQALKYEPTDLGVLLQEVSMLLDSQAILNNVQMFSESLNEHLTIGGDRQQLKQLLVNIIKNAIESMPRGGEILIQMKKVEPDHVSIMIIDQGCGISEERMKRIGEPFFSNKEKGTGLGLTISHKIVKDHRGSIVFQSELNKGTTVEVKFPVLK